MYLFKIMYVDSRANNVVRAEIKAETIEELKDKLYRLDNKYSSLQILEIKEE